MEREKMLDVWPQTNDSLATMAWLMDALEYARKESQTTLVSYLEELVHDVVFEAEMTARR
jgi:hypothetical protein